jgi:tetratricopeptide (TPR) repeat protein
VRAGVQARLEQQLARSGLRWRTCALRPGSQPLANLTESLAGVIGDSASRRIEIRRALNEGRQASAALINVLRLGAADRLCVLLDQFEELFRFAREVNQDESILLTDFLVGFEKNPPEGIYVLVTMRSEFLGDCARYDGLAETINRTQYLLPRMSADDLLRAVCDPPTLYGGRVTDPLAERLIADARSDQDELPLIEHGLAQLWAFSSSNADKDLGPVLDLAAYESSGSLGHLLSQHADDVAVAAGADTAENPIIENLFRCLTEINVEGNAVRRPQLFKEVVSVTGSTPDQLRTILNRFRQPGVSFVTPYAPESIEAETTIDISHEALIRCWRRIADKEAGWLQREFRDGLIWRSLVVQTEAFSANPKNFLSEATTEARGKWLEGRTEAWAKRYGNKWADVADLLAASRREVDRQRQRDEEDRRNAEELRAEQERRAATEQLLKEQELRIEAERQGRAVAEDLLAEQKKHAEADRRAREVAENLLIEQKKRVEAEREGRAAAEQVLKEQELRVSAEVKLAKRRRYATQALAVVSVVVTGLAGIASWQWRDADQQRALALQSERSAEESAALAEKARGQALKEKAATDRSLALATEAVNSLIFDVAQDLRDAVGVPATTVEKILNRARSLQDQLRATGHSSPELLGGEASALNETSQTLLTLGNTPRALDAANDAINRYTELLRSNRDDLTALSGLSRALSTAGAIQQAQGDLARALNSYQKSLAIADQLAASEPSNASWQRDLSTALGNIGSVQKSQGRLDDALDSYRESLAIVRRIAASEPSNATWQRDLAAALGNIGSVQKSQGRLDDALDSYRESIAIVRHLAVSDPGNAGWQRDLSVALGIIGDIQYAQRDLGSALNSYRESLAIVRRLAASDPGNAGWQRDLSVALGNIGDIQQAQDDPAGALKSYQESLSIAERLAASDPSNASWQSDLSAALRNIGEIQYAQHDLFSARNSYQASLAIADHLTGSDPGNADWQRDLALSYGGIGKVYAAQRELAKAREALESGRGIMAALVARSPDNARRKDDLAWFDSQLTALGP